MCGVAGFIGTNRASGVDLSKAMLARLRHRGPDDEGSWTRVFGSGRSEWSLTLAHRRLAVLDLTSAGHQPMISGENGSCLSFNGEIYNFRELREQLKRLGKTFSSDNDAEVVLAAYAAWGVGSLERLHGMYAFALWDEPSKKLILARDRIGIKPLYYYASGSDLVFASELTALRCHPAVPDAIDKSALDHFLTYGFVPGPRTIFEGVRRLMPAGLLTWNAGKTELDSTWALPSVNPAASRAGISFAETCAELEMLLEASIEERLISDVPLGAFLSGGIDSSTVVALMQRQSPRPVKTFTVGFEDQDFDESGYARAIAGHLGTDHHEVRFGADEAVAIARELPNLYDEPFGDASAIPTYLVSRLARQEVTVALSGDGGDELFGGYSRYRRIETFSRVPAFVRATLAATLPHLGQSPSRTRLQLLASRSPAEFASRMTARLGATLVRDFDRRGSVREEFVRAFDRDPSQPAPKRAMRADVATYLVDDILTKLDRASMAVGLEARVPLLDHRLVEFALTLPLEATWHGNVSKAPLRAILSKLVPERLWVRPKRGFGFPITQLLGAELGNWNDRYLSASRLREEGLLDAEAVARTIRTTDRKDRRQLKTLWHLLCFERWFAVHCRGEPVA